MIDSLEGLLTGVKCRFTSSQLKTLDSRLNGKEGVIAGVKKEEHLCDCGFMVKVDQMDPNGPVYLKPTEIEVI